MIDRFILKMREIIHYLLHINIYFRKGIILRGVPSILYGKRINFGKGVRLNEGVFLHASNGITIGDNTTLSYGSTLLTESYNITDWNEYILRHHSGKPITIGRNVWICANVTILPGVNIADNVVVAAGSVVNKDLTREKSLYAGVPARFIKSLEK